MQNEQNEKNGDAHASLKERLGFVVSVTKSNLVWFAIGVILSLFEVIIDLINPRIMSYAVDQIISQKPVNGLLSTKIGQAVELLSDLVREHFPDGVGISLIAVGILFVLVAFVRMVLRYSNGMMIAIGSERLVEELRNRLFRHTTRLKQSWYLGNQTGDLLQRCTSDVTTVNNFLSIQLTSLCRVIFLILMALVFMSRIHPVLMLSSAVYIPVIVIASFVFSKKISESFLKADEEEGRFSSLILENLTAIRVVRAFGRELYEQERFEKENHLFRDMWVSILQIMSVFWASGDVICGLQGLTVLVFGTYLCVKGNLTEGDLIAFIAYNAMLVWPVRELGRRIADLSKAGVSIDRILYMLKAEEECLVRKDTDPSPEDCMNLRKNPIRNEEAVFENETVSENESGADSESDRNDDPIVIRFDHVDFSYPGTSGRDRKVLSDVSFTIRKGESVGILGATGSGKTTLIRLLLGLYELPEGQGEISLYGHRLSDYSLPALRGMFSCVLQEPFLFSGTIRENIAIGSADGTVGEEELEKAVKDSSLESTVKNFSKGIETIVGERGVTLSGGQKQRVAIARSLVRKDASVWILDDALSAVDAQTDHAIRHALSKRLDDETVILIAHRVTTLMGCDHILVFDKGRLIEEGNHESLIRQEGIYRKIYDLQSRV